MESNDRYNIFSESNGGRVDFETLDLNWFIDFLNSYNEYSTIFWGNLTSLEKLIDSQFFFSIDTSNDSFNELQERLVLLDKILWIIEIKLDQSSLKSQNITNNKQKLKDLGIKIDSYKLFYEQRTSRNLATNIAQISDFNTKEWLLLLWNENKLKIKEIWTNLENLEFNKKILFHTLLYILLFIFLIILYFKIDNLIGKDIDLWYFFLAFLLIMIFHIFGYQRKLKYDKFKEILVNTYRFSSISQWLFYINENSNSEKDKIEKQKELVEYYDKHLEKEQNRQVKYWYAKKLFILLVIESILLFAVFWYLINKLSIDDLNKISDLLKWIFGLTLWQIVWMVLLIVKYLFKDTNVQSTNQE